MNKRLKDGDQRRTANNLSILDINMKYLLNPTHDMHENKLCVVSLRHFNWMLPVRYASIGNNIGISFDQRVLRVSCKRTRNKESESKNFENGKMHGAPACNECHSQNALGIQKRRGWKKKGRNYGNGFCRSHSRGEDTSPGHCYESGTISWQLLPGTVNTASRGRPCVTTVLHNPSWIETRYTSRYSNESHSRCTPT